MARQITKQIKIESDVNTLFKALITPSLICKWWFASKAIVLPKKGGLYAVSWGAEDDPDYITVSTIQKFNSPISLTLSYDNYYSKMGDLPFDAVMEASFRIETATDHCVLYVTQTGFPDDAIADDYYQGCITGWEQTLDSIKAVIENSL